MPSNAFKSGKVVQKVKHSYPLWALLGFDSELSVTFYERQGVVTNQGTSRVCMCLVHSSVL